MQTREQYKVVLVDESQDVNPTQFKLLDRLSADSLVMVGDPQQSIYGFRLADRELFLARTRAKEPYRLKLNHRSTQGILAFVDMVFGSWWGEHYVPMRPTEEDFEAGSPPMIGVELWPGGRENRTMVAANIADMVRGGRAPREIAVLVRSARYGIQLRGELGALGVPNLLVGGNESFYTRMEVHDLANALEALADPNDSLAMVSLLHGPFVGLSTDAVFEIALEPVTLDRLRSYEARNSRDYERLEAFKLWYFDMVEYADRLPAWEVCARLFARTGYLPAIVGEQGGLRALANVRKLFAQATKQPDVRAHEFAEQIRSIQRLRHQESEAEQIDMDADAVKIMTVHKAKGLEFEVVVLPEFLRTRQRPNTGPALDARRQLLVNKVGTYQPLIHRLVDVHRKLRESEEEERVLYVAMTRARQRLCLCVPPDVDQSLGGRVASLVGYPRSLETGIMVRQPSPGLHVAE